MGVRTFRSEFAVSLGKVLAYVIGGAREIMAEGARIPRLARALAEELAWYMRGILFSGRAARPIESRHRAGSMGQAVSGAVGGSGRDIQRPRTHMSKILRGRHRGGRAGVVQHHGWRVSKSQWRGLRRGGIDAEGFESGARERQAVTQSEGKKDSRQE